MKIFAPIRNRVLTTLVYILSLTYTACTTTITDHERITAPDLVVKTGSEMEATLDTLGPIKFDKIAAAEWDLPLSGSLNLDHPKAKANGLVDHPEKSVIYFFAIDHPRFGRYLIDTGISESTQKDPIAVTGSLINIFAKLDTLQVHTTTASWLNFHPGDGKLKGVFLTHMHLDHILGIPDLPDDTPIFVGAGELTHQALKNQFLKGATTRLLANKGPLLEIGQTASDHTPGKQIIDFFGDGSLWIIPAFGHTEGSLAFVIRSTDGPVILTGDSCHTVLGWNLEIEPGKFTTFHQENASVLKYLKELASRHPKAQIHLGHQSIPGTEPRSP